MTKASPKRKTKARRQSSDKSGQLKRKPVNARPDPHMPVEEVCRQMDGEPPKVAWSPGAGAIIPTCIHMVPRAKECPKCMGDYSLQIPWLDWSLREFKVGLLMGLAMGLPLGFIAAAKYFA